ncbi:MAG: hypothetical protein HYX68_21140 [Planctomycetes bacterium]|nr:hypothetical protein [Planctomycetota bacterium]
MKECQDRGSKDARARCPIVSVAGPRHDKKSSKMPEWGLTRNLIDGGKAFQKYGGPEVHTIGKFKDIPRSDNLAAWGVGHGIAKEISTTQFFKKYLAPGKSPFKVGGKITSIGLAGLYKGEVTGKFTASNAEVAQFEKDLVRIINFTLKEGLARRTGRYSKYLQEATGNNMIRVSPRALTFIADGKKGYNTADLGPTKQKYDPNNLTSIDYFYPKFYPEYENYKKTKGANALDMLDYLNKRYLQHSKYGPQPVD